MNQSAVLVNADMCLIAEMPGVALFHQMGIRIPLLLLVFRRRRGGNNGGIHNRSLFQNETSFHKCGNHLREQLLLQSVLEQQIAKTTKGISVRNLITGIDAAEIRKRTAGSGIAIPSTGRSVRSESETLSSLSAPAPTHR